MEQILLSLGRFLVACFVMLPATLLRGALLCIPVAVVYLGWPVFALASVSLFLQDPATYWLGPILATSFYYPWSRVVRWWGSI